MEKKSRRAGDKSRNKRKWTLYLCLKMSWLHEPWRKKKFRFWSNFAKCFSGKNNSLRKVEDLINSVQNVPENYLCSPHSIVIFNIFIIKITQVNKYVVAHLCTEVFFSLKKWCQYTISKGMLQIIPALEVEGCHFSYAFLVFIFKIFKLLKCKLSENSSRRLFSTGRNLKYC